MKKILLATTALGLFAGAAHAAGPVVTVGGTADFQVGSGNQERLFTDQPGTGAPLSNLNGLSQDSIYARNLHTRTDTTIHFKVDGKADNGLGYGAFIELNADTSANDTTESDNSARRTYIYVESGFGRVETGAMGDAGNALKVDASTFARATGGVGGDFYKYVDLGHGDIAGGTKYQILPGLPTAAGLPGEANGGYATSSGSTSLQLDTHEDRANANKISYYTPRIQGVQAGVSFTPDQAERGTANGFASANGGAAELNGYPAFLNVWNGGLNYQGQYNSVGINAAVTAEYGASKDNGTTPTSASNAAYDGLEAYNLGLSLSYAGFTVGGSWEDAPQIGGDKTFNSSLKAFTLGGAYEFGPFGASVTYYDSTVKHGTSATAADADFTNISVGADYKLAPGLMPYVEVSFFDSDNGIAETATTVDNSGTVFIVGTQLTF